MATTTVWERITFSQLRRMWQRGQSLQRTGSVGRGTSGLERGEDGPRTGAEGTGGFAGSGQKTALTRRGFTVELLS